jgi:serine/threonine protein kinase
MRADLSEIKKRLEELLAVSPEEREIGLSSIAVQDKSLADELRKLLKGQEIGGLLSGGAQIPKEAHDPREHKFSPGDRIAGKFEVAEYLGSGGFGDVYKIKNQQLRRYEIVKVLRLSHVNDPRFVERFRREAEILSAFTHERIPVVFEADFDSEKSQIWIRMQYISGTTLSRRLKEDLGLDWKSAVRIAIDVASTLEAAHKKGIIHRDIKPDNIIIVDDEKAWVLDFGIAMMIDFFEPSFDAPRDRLTKTGMIMGTPGYMSPEQRLDPRSVDSRSDVWSLGAVLFEMIYGSIPSAFESDTLPEPSKSVPDDLVRIIRKAITVGRDTRFQTAQELKVELESLMPAAAIALTRRSGNPLHLFTPQSVKVTKLDDSERGSFYPVDLGKAWGLDRGSFLGFAFNPFRIPIFQELNGLEQFVHDALREAETAGAEIADRIWLRVHSEGLTIKKQSIENIYDILISEDKPRAIEFLNASPKKGVCLGFVFTLLEEPDYLRFTEMIGSICAWIFSTGKSSGWQTAIIFDLQWENRPNFAAFLKQISEAMINYPESTTQDCRNEAFLIEPVEGAVIPESSEINSYETILAIIAQKGGENEVRNWLRAAGLPSMTMDSIIRKRSFDSESETPHFSQEEHADLDLIEYFENGEALQTFLQLVNNFLPLSLGNAICNFARSENSSIILQALLFATRSDYLMDCWLEGGVTGNLESQFRDGFYHEAKTSVVEALVLACVRRINSGKNVDLLSDLLITLRSSSDLPKKRLIDHTRGAIKLSELLDHATMKDFWLYSRCGIGTDVINNSMERFNIEDFQYWRCFATTVLDRAQVRSLLGLEVEKRTVFGLCSRAEWKETQQDPLLRGYVNNCRSHRQLCFQTD